jgi:hypothetical protein
MARRHNPGFGAPVRRNEVPGINVRAFPGGRTKLNQNKTSDPKLQDHNQWSHPIAQLVGVAEAAARRPQADPGVASAQEGITRQCPDPLTSLALVERR